MSYLHMYESSKGIASEEHDFDTQKVEEENVPIQAKYVGLNLSTSIAAEILNTLEAVQAINLSHNNIDSFPQEVSPSLLALDLSFNQINTPFVMNSAFNIVELNLSNNNIADLRGISMLISIEYLNLSENLISTVDGLENMKNLSSLKLNYNRISSFQGIRLLSYNSVLTDIWLEGNPIENDVYYKVKLLNCIPNIKSLDGKTIWRRTAIQNQLINDNIKYTELYQRKPDDVEKYAQLSKRSSSQLLNESVLNTFSGSMLTMQSLLDRSNKNSTAMANNTTDNISYTNNRINPNITSKQNYNTTVSSSNNQYCISDSLSSPPKPEQLRRLPSNLRHLSDITAVNAHNNSYTSSSTPYNTNSHSSTNSNAKENKNDISMLPAHLQKQLKQLRQSPSPPKRSSTRSHSSKPVPSTHSFQQPHNTGSTTKHTTATGTTTTTTTSSSSKAPIEQRSYSPLPWRRPPSITPNLETKFKSNRSSSAKKLQSDRHKSDTLEHKTFSTEQSKIKKAEEINYNQRKVSIAIQNEENLRSKQEITPSAIVQTTRNLLTPSQSFRRNSNSFSSSQKPKQQHQPQEPVTIGNYASTTPSINNTIEKSQKILTSTPSFWMHPALNPPPNPTTPSGSLLGPPPNRFDSTQMERTISSSVIALQQSFDADSRQNIGNNHAFNESFRGRSMLRTPSTKRLSNTKSVERHDSSRRIYGSGNNSVISRSVSPNRRSISQTRSSMGRQSFNAEILRNRQETEEKARDLAEAHTFERPTPVSPHRNAAYTIHQGVHSPTAAADTPSSMGSTVFTFTSSKLAFSPKKATSRHGSQASVLPGHTASPPRMTSTERILQHYSSKQDHQRSQFNNNKPPVVLLDEPVGVQRQLQLSSIPETTSISTPNEETKETVVPINNSTEPPVSTATDTGNINADESPYKRFIRLRERLSAKYLDTTEHGHTQPAPSDSAPSEIQQQQQQETISPSHLYDYARRMNVDAVEGMLNPLLRSPNAEDFGEVESKIVELQEQDLQFQKLKEQYQQQYQAQYDSMRKDYNAKLGSNPVDTTATSHVTSSSNAATTATIGMQPQIPFNMMSTNGISTDTPVAQAMASVLPHKYLSPPRTGTTDVLKDLIERRRAVLGRITQPNELSPDRVHRTTGTSGSIENLPTGQGIYDAISALKNRQSASVNILQSTTQNRPAPQPVYDNLSQVSINNPALHPSISNYSNLTNLSPLHTNQSVVLPGPIPTTATGISSLPTGNNFLLRLSANNPYMQSMSSTTHSATAPPDASGIMGMSGYAQMDLSRSFEPNAPYIPQFLPAHYQQQQQQQPHPAAHISTAGYPPRPPKPFYG